MTLIKRKYRMIDNHPWAYIDAGVTTKPPLLLVHGIMSFANFFDPMIEQLKKDYYVIAPDLPGFGYTPPLNNNSAELVSNSFIKFCKSFNLQQCNVFGASLGGFIVLLTAIKEKHLFNTLMVQSPVWRTQNLSYGLLERFELALASLPVAILNKINSPTLSRLLIKVAALLKPNLQSVWSRYEHMIIASISLLDFIAVKQLWTSISDTDLSQKLEGLDLRSLIITSTDDHLVPISETVDLQQKLKYAELMTIPSGGHELLFSKPTQLSKLITQFITSQQ